MRFASLGSGSRGNALVVEAAGTRLLVDCGFGPRILAKRLARLGLAPAEIDAVVVTHEHSDHVGGLAACAAAYRFDVFMTHGTLMAYGRNQSEDIRLFDGHVAFGVGAFEVRPFPVPHDAREPVQFVLSDGRHTLGVLTDTGHVTPHAVEMLSGCDALVLECNHDAAMLEQGRYPYPLKRRIAGRFGHLENREAADLLRQIDRRKLQRLVCAHLSQQNNTPELAVAALAEALGGRPDWLSVAGQDDGFDWLTLD